MIEWIVRGLTGVGRRHGRELWFHRGTVQNRFGVNLHFKLARHPARNLLICTLLCLLSLSHFIISVSDFPDLMHFFSSFFYYFLGLADWFIFQCVSFFPSPCVILSFPLLWRSYFIHFFNLFLWSPLIGYVFLFLCMLSPALSSSQGRTV